MAFLLDCLAVVMIGPAWWYSGKLAQRLKLPLVTGYIIGGVISGPYAVSLLTSDVIEHLKIVENACLSLIALAAGAELHFSELQKSKREVVSITLGISIATWLAVFCTLLGLAPFLPMTDGLQRHQVEGIASLAATLAVARSPASAIAVLREIEGKGPFCSLVMAVVVVKDVLVFVVFAINIEFSAMLMRNQGGGVRLGNLIEPLVSLVISVWLGVAGATALALAHGLLDGPGMRQQPVPRALQPLLRRLPFPLLPKVRVAVLACISASVFLLAEALGAEALLACVVTGLIAANRRGDGKGEGLKEEMSAGLLQLVPWVNCAFFGLSGASLRLKGLAAGMWAAGIVFAVRGAAIYCGAWLGCWVGRAALEHRRKVWCGMITQAGVALGLAKQVSARFPGWGPDFVALMVSVIIMNLLAGPPLFRSAVVASGEAHALLSSPALTVEIDGRKESKRGSGSKTGTTTPGSDVEKGEASGSSRPGLSRAAFGSGQHTVGDYDL